MITPKLPFPGFLYTSYRTGWYYSEGTRSHTLHSAYLYYYPMMYNKEITWVPAACKLLQHPGRPTGHHRWYPTCHHGKPPLALQSSPFPQLNEAGHLHLCFKKGKESTTEQNRDKAHPAVLGILLSHSITSSPLSPPEAYMMQPHSTGCCWSRAGYSTGCYSD